MSLILIRGLPGSGKTTLAKSVFDCHILLEADLYFEDVNGKYIFDKGDIEKAHLWCFKTTKELLKQGKKVVVANTFTQRWEIQPYIDLAILLNKDYIIFRKTQDYGTIHNIPDDVINKMKERFEDIEDEKIL